MKKAFTRGLLFLYMCAALTGCDGKMKKTDIVLVKNDGGEVLLRAELAVTPEQQARGFMNRKDIPNGTGMLFIFPRDQRAQFWMKNTPAPLSIAYIDSSGVIRDIFDMEPYNLSSIISSVSVRYALEVPQGWFGRVGIGPGDRMRLTPEMETQKGF
ncbi:MAG: DUF192 domain-containing protein [Spirochaetaceae bacterium]|jgi:uncharacterized membrane protein (UPF0127 family)|nr:DUF192 domain-containing protein [Spirochaetaceae bacterium]